MRRTLLFQKINSNYFISDSASSGLFCLLDDQIFFRWATLDVLDVIFHQCLRWGLWLLSTPIRKHFSDLC